MRIVSKKRIDEFGRTHPNSNQALLDWLSVLKPLHIGNFGDLQALFPSVNKVGKLYIFDIGGNKYRLIAAIHFNTQMLYIRNILTHKEYDKEKWKE